eukprot:3841639-Pleurochrysis_carterae.AAC.1
MSQQKRQWAAYTTRRLSRIVVFASSVEANVLTSSRHDSTHASYRRLVSGTQNASPAQGEHTRARGREGGGVE